MLNKCKIIKILFSNKRDHNKHMDLVERERKYRIILEIWKGKSWKDHIFWFLFLLKKPMNKQNF